VLACERAHRASAATLQVQLDPVAAVRSYISDNIASFRTIPDPSITTEEFRRAPGFVYQRPGVTEYVFSRPIFEREFAHLNVSSVVRALDKAKLLIRGSTRDVSKVPVRNSADDGREWAYRVRSAILGDG